MRDTKHDSREAILVWLPQPMGDAVLCTPALRSIRQRFETNRICFFANNVVRQVLTPNNFNDDWIEQSSRNPFAIAKTLEQYKFTHAVLFKNSFASALVCFLAGIPSRIGYCRQGRGVFLTEKLYPSKISKTKFQPLSMVDYYLAVASWLGADTANRKTELLIDQQDYENLKSSLPEAAGADGPLIILVPGGAFGPSKCWAAERFAETADRLICAFNATVFISVSDNPCEKKIAARIRGSSENNLIDLAQRPLTLGRLKSLFSISDLVITNDTGPRHIAIALGRKVVSLFGPNNPVWTDTGYEDEIQIVGDAACAPCHRPICKKTEHICMQAISVEMVFDAAKKLLENSL